MRGVSSERIGICLPDRTNICHPTREATGISNGERSSSIKRSLGAVAPSENALLVVVAFVFLVLNVLVGVFVHSALPHEPAQGLEQMAAVHGD